MRKITRPALALPTLRQIEVKYQDVPWKETGHGGPAGSDWNEADVRGVLIAMHGFACAYCELDLRGGDRGDVEHFRPKSLYRWLAYDFDNYLLSCLACNREMKGNRFPLEPGESPVIYVDRNRLHAERRLLLDPASDPTVAMIDYDVFNPDTLCRAIPRQGLSGRQAAMAKRTIEFYELNVGRDLSESRREIVKQVELRVRGLELGDDRLRELLELELTTMACRFKPHSTVVRRLLDVRYSHLIPDPEEELLLLVEDLAGRLKRCWIKLGEPADRRATERERRTEQELLHALAALWLAPPAMDSQMVGDSLEELGVKAAVDPVRIRLKTA
jgi:uncharacterized protein (TIGR02646 family)